MFISNLNDVYEAVTGNCVLKGRKYLLYSHVLFIVTSYILESFSEQRDAQTDI